MGKRKSQKAYLTPNEVASMLMVSTESVRQWAQKGWLKAEVTPGGHRRFLYRDVQRFAQDRRLEIRSGSGELRLLVVDDNRQFAEFIRDLFDELPQRCCVRIAQDGFSAGAEVHPFKPHIILLDLMMPGLDGFETCKLLKSDASTRDIRVFAMTGFPSEENTARIAQAGAEACFSKPLDIRLFLDALGLAYSMQQTAEFATTGTQTLGL